MRHQTARPTTGVPWARSIRARLLVLVLVPAIAGMGGVAAFLVLAGQQGRAEDAVRRTLTLRAATQEAHGLLDELDNAQWSQMFGDTLPMPATALPPDQVKTQWDASTKRLRALVASEPSRLALVDDLVRQIERKEELTQKLAGSIVKNGKLDLSGFLANPGMWASYQAPEETLNKLQASAEEALSLQTASAEKGRRQLQVAVPILVGLGILVGLALALAAGRALGKRVLDVERNARRLADGEPLEPVTAGNDEVGMLARALEEAAVLLTSRENDLRVAKDSAESANTAKSEFLSRMSHELRTPLNAVLGFGQLLNMNAAQTPEDRDSTEKILTAGRHLLALIDDVLDVSRIEVGAIELSIEPVELETTIREALDLVRPLAADRPVRIEWNALAFRGRYVRADARRLSQVLLNLLSNAIKYNVEDGTVTIGLEHHGDGTLRVCVTDTGLGIAAEQLGRLFTPFERLGVERTGIEGTGLGLALTKRLVEAMGGSIELESVQGAGSMFSIALPETEGLDVPAALPDDQPPALTSRNGTATILYVEDNLANLRLVERVVARRPGVRLLSAMQGRLGLELARQHRPDLILLDLHLPDLAGEEVFERLKADGRTAGIPVVAISADATHRRIERLAEGGVFAYLTKPFDIDVFLSTIDRALARGDARSEAV